MHCLISRRIQIESQYKNQFQLSNIMFDDGLHIGTKQKKRVSCVFVHQYHIDNSSIKLYCQLHMYVTRSLSFGNMMTTYRNTYTDSYSKLTNCTCKVGNRTTACTDHYLAIGWIFWLPCRLYVGNAATLHAQIKI